MLITATMFQCNNQTAHTHTHKIWYNIGKSVNA